jgi:VWFA-related protein
LGDIITFCPLFFMKSFKSGAKAVVSWVLSATLVIAQTPTPPPLPGSEQPIARVTTRLIQLNVVAQDRHGNPVMDLTKDDFVLKDAGKEQTIKVFSMERSDVAPSATVGGRVMSGQTLPPGTFTNRVERKVGAVTVILFDRLNTKLTDSISAKAQLVKYIKQMSPDDQVALYVQGRDLKLVHDFTRSPEALMKAVNGDKLNAINSVAADADPEDSDTGNDDLDAAMDRANQNYSDYVNAMRAQQTLESLQSIAQHVSHIPGRKNLVWISSGFPFSMNQDTMNIDNPRDSRDFSEETQKMARFMNDANLAIYAIDARGLFQTAIPDASSRGNTKANRPPPPPKVDHQYETFDILAERTGGKAFHNTNDITGAIKKAVEDAKVTYTIGFYPADAKWDGQFHQLKLHCNRSGVNIRYRPGYFASSVPPEQTTRRYTTVQQAIMASTNLNEVGFTVQLTPKDNDVAAKVVIDPGYITMTEQDGKWVGTVQFLAVGGNVEKSQFDDQKVTIANIKFTPEVHEAVLKSGLTITHTFHMKPDTNQFRFAIQDVPSGGIGSLVLTLRRGMQAPATGSPRLPEAK